MADAKTMHGPCKATEALEPALAQPCYEGMDDTADYAQTLPRHRGEPLEGMLVVECPEVSHG